MDKSVSEYMEMQIIIKLDQIKQLIEAGDAAKAIDAINDLQSNIKKLKISA